MTFKKQLKEHVLEITKNNYDPRKHTKRSD